jgi:hypothetical protein
MMFVTAGQGQKKKKAPPPPPGTGGTKDQQQKHLSSLSLSSTDQDITDPHKTTSLERHLSGKSSVVASAQSPDKSSTLPGKLKMSQHNYRPVEPPVQKSENTPETETLSPEETCLDSDQILEVEEDTTVANIPKETCPIRSQTHQDKHNIAATSQISRDVSEIQDERLQSLPPHPIETVRETPIELASRSKSPQVVDTSTPEGKLVASKVEMSTDLSSWEGRWKLEAASSPYTYKEKRSSSFCSESPPFTSRYSLHSRLLNPVHRRSSETRSSKLQTTHQNSNIKTLSDVYDHKNKIGQDINNACSKLPDYNSKPKLHSTIPLEKLNRSNLYDVGKLVQPSCTQIRYRSSLNSNQKLVNSDSQKLKTLVRSSSVITAQRNSDFVVASPEKYVHGFEADIHNHSPSENVICTAKLDKITSKLTSEHIKYSSVVPQEQFIPNRNWSDITDPSDKHSTSQNAGNSPYNSSAVSKRKYDGRRLEGQLSPEKTVSLLVPPPPDFLVSHGESSQSWNRFLEDLDRILENRAEFV